ncbi:MAG: PilZ domain-containing protein [Gammaproteobacteria bacterium]
MNRNRRRFRRYPGGLALHYYLASKGQVIMEGELKDLGLGGLGLYCREPLMPGLSVEVSVVNQDESISFSTTVLWCQGTKPLFEAGARFARGVDPFRARMLEQVCCIEAYRRRIHNTTGQSSSADRAALEWIRKFASRFPSA